MSWGQISVIIAVLLAPFVIFRLYARRIEQRDGSVEDRLHQLRRAETAGSFVLPGAAVGVALLFNITGSLEVTATALLPVADGVVESFVFATFLFLLFAGSLTAVQLGSYPVKRKLRGTTGSRARVVRNTAGAVAFALFPIIFVIEGIDVAGSYFGSSLPVILGALVVLIGFVFVLSPYLLLVFNERVELTGSRRERVERLCAELGYRPRELYLLEGTEMKVANAIVAGTVPGYRYVFLTDYLVSEASDEQLKAILAHEIGHVERRHLSQQFVATIAVFGGAIVAYTMGADQLLAPFEPIGIAVAFVLLFALYYLGVLGALSIRHEYQADAYAARQAGKQETASALDLLATANDMRRESGLLYSLVTMHPPIGERISALETDSGS